MQDSSLMNPLKHICLFLFLFSAVLPTACTAQSAEAGLLARADSEMDKLGQFLTFERDKLKIKFGVESRYRLEYKDDFNFNDAAYEDDAINLFRDRLNADLTVGSRVRGFIEAQDAESFAESRLNKTSLNVNRFDLRQLFTELKSPWDGIPVSVKVGRQELSYGDQRFVGAFNWSNVARVFDAVKAIYTPKKWLKADVWLSQVVSVKRLQADSAAHEDNFYGAYTTLGPFREHVLDMFLFVRHNKKTVAGERSGEVGQLKEYTLGNRFKGKHANLDYGIEWAFQFGSRTHDKIRAWAWHNEVGYTFASVSWTPRVDFEFNYGSGDDNTTDGIFKNFDNLFPTNHFFYGYMDFASLRNMNNFKIGLEAKPYPKLKLVSGYHWFFLDSNKSAWFNASSTVIRAAAPGASTTLGQEIDLLAKWQMMKHLEILLGYSHFFTGAFVSNTGSSSDANFFYLQTVFTI